jgi:uncharacterized membrane-anchored protein
MITKTIFYFALLFVLAFCFVQGVQSPGELTISWFGYYIEVNIMFAIVFILVFMLMVQVMMHLLTLAGVLPSFIKYRAENKKLRSGLEGLKEIALNLSLGNKAKAIKLAKKNQRVIPEYPVFDEMLNIKSKNDLTNDIVDVRMAKTKIDDFVNQYDNDKALKIIENILKQHPDSVWAKQKQYTTLLALAEFEAALNILKQMKKQKIISKEQFNLENAFIHYELALNEDDALEALKLSETGLKSQANFIKLAEHSALVFVQTEQTEKALKLLISLAKSYHHALAVYDVFKSVVTKLETADQIKWFDKFAKINSKAAGCQLAKAQSYLLQEKYDEAIAFLENNDKTKETLLALGNIYKSNGDNLQSIRVLELANNLPYLERHDLIKEYKLWQENCLQVEESETTGLGQETVNDSLLLNND